MFETSSVGHFNLWIEDIQEQESFPRWYKFTTDRLFYLKRCFELYWSKNIYLNIAVNGQQHVKKILSHKQINNEFSAIAAFFKLKSKSIHSCIQFRKLSSDKPEIRNGLISMYITTTVIFIKIWVLKANTLVAKDRWVKN